MRAESRDYYFYIDDCIMMPFDSTFAISIILLSIQLVNNCSVVCGGGAGFKSLYPIDINKLKEVGNIYIYVYIQALDN